MSFNRNVLSSSEAGGVLQREYGSGTEADTILCTTCEAFFSKKAFYKHRASCTPEPSNKATAPSISKPLHPSIITIKNNGILSSPLATQFRDEVLGGFRKNQVGDLCRSDDIIKVIGLANYEKNKKGEKKNVMTEMRRLAHLVLQCRFIVGGNFSAANIFEKNNFNIVSQAVHDVATTEGGKSLESTKVAIAYLLKGAAGLLVAHYYINDQDDKARAVEIFGIVLEQMWKPMVNRSNFAILRRSQEINRLPKKLPIEENVTQLNNYICREFETFDNDTVWDEHRFSHMRSLLITHITFYNARRGGEAARLTLAEWDRADTHAWIDSQRLHGLDDIGRQLCQTQLVTFLSGKGNHFVPVIFPDNAPAYVRLLVEARHDCGISPNNTYLFPSGRGSMTHVVGSQAIFNVCKDAGVPQVTATAMRHRLATLYGQIHVPPEIRAAFIRHMAHSQEINERVYQCAPGIGEITQVGPTLQRFYPTGK